MALKCHGVRARKALLPALWLWVAGWALPAEASAVAMALATPAVHQEKAYSFGRSFLGLDKCNACVGTSICKKLFKEDIR